MWTHQNGVQKVITTEAQKENITHTAMDITVMKKILTLKKTRLTHQRKNHGKTNPE